MFLNDRKIIDVIGITQEFIHSIKKSDLYALLLKMDLVKAYDMVDMVYFIVLLLQIGLLNFATDYIMSCGMSTLYAMLINGSPAEFFKGSIGIKKGFFLSPIMFVRFFSFKLAL